MSYHILKSGILSILLETCVSAKTKVVQWVKPSNCLRYSWVRVPQKSRLTRFDDFCSNLDMRISLFLEGTPVYQQKQNLFSWLSPTTLSVTAKYVFLRNPDISHLTVYLPVYLQRQKMFSWSGSTSLTFTGKYVFVSLPF